MAVRIPHMLPVVLDVPHGQAFGPCSAIGVVNEYGQIQGGVVYHNYQPHFRSVELSCASVGRRWLTKDILRALLRYPLVQLNCNRLQSVTPRKSDESRLFLEQLGFKREGVARFGFGDDHAMVYGLLAKEWAKHPYNRERTARPGAVTHGQVRPEAAPRA